VTSGGTGRPPGEWRRTPDLGYTPILASALDAFYEAGYHGTSVRDIARRVGLTVPALYYHHKNKEAILSALLGSSVHEVLWRCQQALDEAGLAAEDRFLNLIECLVRYCANCRKAAAMNDEVRALGPEAREAYRGKRLAIQQLLVAAIEQGNGEGIFDAESPPETARALLGMIQAVAGWYKPGGPLTVDQVARRYQDIAAHAVGGSPAVIKLARTPE
jgi:AcrR family transcriptional regulator